jgi:hypothetical protein
MTLKHIGTKLKRTKFDHIPAHQTIYLLTGNHLQYGKNIRVIPEMLIYLVSEKCR